jgi:modulator of FtsH protease HflK
VLKSGELVDLAIVSVELPMHYVVSNVQAYDMLGPPEQRDAILKAVAQRESTRFFQGTHLDEVLGFGRIAIGTALRERIQAAFDQLNATGAGAPLGAGVKVVYVGISGVHPPKDTAASFESPVQADARKIANIMGAEADAVATLTTVVGDHRLAGQIVDELKKLQDLSTQASPDVKAIAAQEFAVQQLIEKAGGKAGSALAQARADRWKRHMDARGKAARYVGQEALYAAAPDVFLSNEYFRSLKSIMNGSRVYITGAGAGANWYNLDATDKDLGTDVFKPEESIQ